MKAFLKLLSEQQYLSGGTSLIILYIPANAKITISTRNLNREYGLASNIKSKTVQKDVKTALKSGVQQFQTKSSSQWFDWIASGLISGTCFIDDQWAYKGAILLDPEALVQKAMHICGKPFYLEPVLSTYKKKIIEDPISSKMLEMIEKGEVDRIDFGCKHITNDYSHMIITDKANYQSHAKLETKTKIVYWYSKKLYRYRDMIGLKWY